MRARIIAPAAAVLLGGALAALLTRQLLRRHRNRLAARTLERDQPIEAILVYDDSVDVDALDELTALADATVLDTAEAASPDPELVLTSAYEDEVALPRDVGVLYGIQAPRAQQPVTDDDDRAQARGENWFEALEEDSIENGPDSEAALSFLDDNDPGSSPSDTRDRPIADLGSGGPRGV